jgi:hypothetical protein
VILLKKLTTLILSGVVTLGIGAGAIFGNGFIASHAMAASINTGSSATINPQNILPTSQADDKDTVTDALHDFSSDIKIVVLQKSGTGSAVIIGYGADGEILGTKQIDDLPLTFVKGEPGENDIAKEKAIEVATNALVQKYALKQEILNRFSNHAEFNVVNPDFSQWCIDFSPTNPNELSEIGCYYVTVNSQTGEVMKVTSASGDVG